MLVLKLKTQFIATLQTSNECQFLFISLGTVIRLIFFSHHDHALRLAQLHDSEQRQEHRLGDYTQKRQPESRGSILSSELTRASYIRAVPYMQSPFSRPFQRVYHHIKKIYSDQNHRRRYFGRPNQPTGGNLDLSRPQLNHTRIYTMPRFCRESSTASVF